MLTFICPHAIFTRHFILLKGHFQRFLYLLFFVYKCRVFPSKIILKIKNIDFFLPKQSQISKEFVREKNLIDELYNTDLHICAYFEREPPHIPFLKSGNYSNA